VDERHGGVVKAMLNGTMKPYLGIILKLLYEDAQRTNFLKKDTGIPPTPLGVLEVQSNGEPLIRHTSQKAYTPIRHRVGAATKPRFYTKIDLL